jgi:hypothetical protein
MHDCSCLRKVSCRKRYPPCFPPRNETKRRYGYGTARKRRRPYRTTFPDLETPYGTAGGVSWPYRPVRPAFRASLRRNKKKKGGRGAPKQSIIFFFCIFYVFLASLLHFFCIIMFFLQYNVLFKKKKTIYIYIYIYIIFFIFLYTAFPRTFPFFGGLFRTVPVSET